MDALAEIFFRLETSANTNTNQIVLIAGVVQAKLLARAINDSIVRYPLLLSAPTLDGKAIIRDRYRPENVPIHYCLYEREMSFECREFRQFLLRLSEANQIRWCERPPVQFFLITAGRGDNRSCLYMNCSHAVADAKSDSLLIEDIMTHYGALIRAQRGLAGPRGKPNSARIANFSSLFDIVPKRFTGSARMKRLLSSGAKSVGDLLRRDDGFVLRRSDFPTGHNGADAYLDFYHEVLPAPLASMLREVTSKAGCTLNSVFTAALVRLLEQRGGQASSRRCVRVTCAVSLRRLVEQRYREDFRSYFVPCTLVIEKGLGSAYLLRQIQSKVDQLKRDGIYAEIGKAEAITLILRRRRMRPLGLKLIERVQGTNACYSNPGVIEEQFTHFGIPDLPIIGYVGFGCVVPPYDFILYTPQIDGRLHLNAVYRNAAFSDFKREFIHGLKEELRRLADEFVAATPQADAMASSNCIVSNTSLAERAS